MDHPAPSSSINMTASTRSIKCLVWDLDHTIWDGILSENDVVHLRYGIKRTLRNLDQRGILQSVASRNDFDQAWAMLQKLKIDHYFLVPQIHWNAKHSSIEAIARELNLGLDSFGFIDDQAYERAEVQFHLPEVSCYDAIDAGILPDKPEFNPRFVTDESSQRRELYRADQLRKKAEGDSEGQDTFNRSLKMKFGIWTATREDLKRIEELTLRTNQLNATGITYSYEELEALLESENHWLLVADLEDIFGAYGKIGVALVEKSDEAWTIKLLLMSCRVMSRGVGGVLLQFLVSEALKSGKQIRAEFIDTGRNRQMQMAYRFGGFVPLEKQPNGIEILSYNSDAAIPFPSHIEIVTENPRVQP